MDTILLVVQLLSALALIGIVLVQRTNQAGLGLGDGGGGQQAGLSSLLSGRSKANTLTRMTAGLAVIFLAACLLSAILASTGNRTNSLLDQLEATSTGVAPSTSGDNGGLAPTPLAPAPATPSAPLAPAASDASSEPTVPAVPQ